MADVVADAINTIKVNENVGKDECVVVHTKLVGAMLNALKENGYIQGFGEQGEGHRKKFRVVLAKRINDIGVIKPRIAIGIDDFQRYETRYIPSKDFGMLIVSTSSGIMTNRQAKEKHIGGRLLAYVY